MLQLHQLPKVTVAKYKPTPWTPTASISDRGNYYHVLPWDAARMSRTGVALGYDIDRWRDWEGGPAEEVAVARATAKKFEMTLQTSVEREFLHGWGRDDARNRGESQRRRILIERLNKMAWEQLSEQQRNFALSLLWVPEEPRPPLEMLAIQMEND